MPKTCSTSLWIAFISIHRAFSKLSFPKLNNVLIRIIYFRIILVFRLQKLCQCR